MRSELLSRCSPSLDSIDGPTSGTVGHNSRRQQRRLFFLRFLLLLPSLSGKREREGRPAPVHLAITALVRRVWPLLSAKSNVGLFAIMSMNNDRSRLMGRVDILLPPPPPPPASSGEGISFFLFLLLDPLSFLCPLGGRRPVPSRFRQVRKENRRMLC